MIASLLSLRPTNGDYLARLQGMTPKDFRRYIIPPDAAGRYSYPPCAVLTCERVAHRQDKAFCRPCQAAYTKADEADEGTFASSHVAAKVKGREQGGDSARGIFRPSAAESAVVRAELSWALWQRASPSNGLGPARASAFNALISALNSAKVKSILELRGESERASGVLDACGAQRDLASSMLSSSMNALAAELGDPTAKRNLGRRRGGSSRYSRSQEISQAWLRDLTQRWVSYRLSTEHVGAQHVGQQEASVVIFAKWAEQFEMQGAPDLTRQIFIAWLSHVAGMVHPETGKRYSGSHRSRLVASIANFVAISRFEFGAPFPANTLYLHGERPERDYPSPRFLEPKVIARLRSEEAFALILDEDHRLIVRIMISTGVRVGHTCALDFDCLIDLNKEGQEDKWALRISDTKAGKVIALPLDPHVAKSIRVYQARLLTKYGRSNVPSKLFPNPRALKTGQIAPERVNVTLKKLVKQLDLREANGELVNVTPHRFRHTFATEMLDRGVPIQIIQELLGHGSLASTQIYATVNASTLRSEWEKAQIVDIRGDVLGLIDGERGDAEWLLHRVGQAVQPLANGYCGLPIQQSCPHANACLGCDSFSTSAVFLPVLVQQRDEHARFVSKAELAGHFRIAEINRQPMAALDRIITTLNTLSSEEAN